MAKRNLVVIGAGAAGLMAAVTAAENGALSRFWNKMTGPAEKSLQQETENVILQI